MTNEEVKKRIVLFEDTVLDMIEHIVEELIGDPEAYYVESRYEVDEKNATLVVYVPNETLPFVIGNSNKDLLAAIKKIAFKVANQHGFYLDMTVEGY